MFVARDKELETLRSALDSDASQFIAVYGRRRVGKTVLVREAFDDHFTFAHAGVANGSLADQLLAFSASLKEAGLEGFDEPTNWFEAFSLLKELIRGSGERKKVVFIDELSWMDTPRSKLVMTIESFWNGWASARRDVVLVVCASATSWMMNKVVHNKGGLYNRLTGQIALRPFTLGECEEMLQAKGISMSRHQIIEGYMVMGGVPYYWDKLNRGLSLPQNIDAVFFAEDAPLKDEFGYLYASIFKNPDGYLDIIKALCGKKAGLTRNELVERLGKASSSGGLTRRLADLESCGFIRRYHAFGKRDRDALYQLVDNFTLFYYKFMEGRPTDPHFWSNSMDSGAHAAWCGIAFERVCLEHAEQIKRALGISGVLTDMSAWSCKADEDEGTYGSQVDLVIARRDKVIDLCEMKYATDEYEITKSEDERLRHRKSDFRKVTKTRDALHTVMVTPYGVRHNKYWGNVQGEVTAEDLFA